MEWSICKLLELLETNSQLLDSLVNIFLIFITIWGISFARRELSINRRSNSFSWEPLIEISISSLPSKGLQDQELTIPRHSSDVGYRDRLQKIKKVSDDLHKWRDEYSKEYEQPPNIPHLGHDYVFLHVSNLQNKLSGQATNIWIFVDFTYPKPISYTEIINNRFKNKKQKILLKINYLKPYNKISLPIAFIEMVPHFQLKVTEVSFSTWENIKINRGIVESVDFKNGDPNHKNELTYKREGIINNLRLWILEMVFRGRTIQVPKECIIDSELTAQREIGVGS